MDAVGVTVAVTGKSAATSAWNPRCAGIRASVRTYSALLAPRIFEKSRGVRVGSATTTSPMLGIGPGQGLFRRKFPRSGEA